VETIDRRDGRLRGPRRHHADDGDSGHSPFTQALLANLETPNVDIRIMFSKVRDQVLASTNDAQEPFTYGSLPGQEFYFKPATR
jgi:uncharacterized caspase-like protein